MPSAAPIAPAAVGPSLPAGVTVFERGWLSGNNILILGQHHSALIDSGYHSHAAQTLALVQAALQGRPLDWLLNTHLHSDHCGGNAALQAAWPQLHTLIPPGQAALVRHWDAYALSYTPTGQHCPRFGFDDVLQPGAELRLGDARWQVHGAPGHDPHSVILFEPHSRCLISADALWQQGFGVVFPELDGAGAFDDVAATLDVIEALRPLCVIPGHGGAFTDVAQALARARLRLAGFVANPHKHLRHAARVLLKFKLLEAGQMARAELLAWAQGTPYLTHLFARQLGDLPLAQGLDVLVQELVRSGAARLQGALVCNA